MKTNKEKCKVSCSCQIEGKTHSMNDGCGCPAHNYVDKQQEVRESVFHIAQDARERVKSEAFHKDLDTGKNSLDLTHTREIIIEAINQAIEQERERIREVLKGICNKSKTERGLARAISNLIKNL